jgi:hypothetical protein
MRNQKSVAKAPKPPTYQDAIGYARSIIAKLDLISTIDSNNIVVLLGGRVNPTGDALPQHAKDLIDWLIDIQYLQDAPTRYKFRRMLQLHDRFSSPEAALRSFKLQFARELGDLTASRRARDERLAAMPTIAYQQKLQQIGA